ncbi:autophagy protein atg9 [Tulasnella sp. 427]|nr:autophagy protein atg9 [Tulasnella sp. 427]
MSYESTDSLQQSGRASISRSNAGNSLVSSRPFLALLNPINRQHRGYQHLAETTLQEEDKEQEEQQLDQPGTSSMTASRARGVGWKVSNEEVPESHELRVTSPQPFHNDVDERDPDLTEPEDEGEVPNSFFLESASARDRKKTARGSKAVADSATSSPKSRSSKRSRRAHAKESSYPNAERLSKPPRPSELDDRPVMEGDAQGTATAFASTRPQRGLDEYQKAMWNWVNAYNLDAYLQEVYAYYTGKGIYCIALSRGLNLLTVGFVIGFSTFLLGCVDYSKVHKDGTGQLGDLIIHNCVSRISGFSLLLFICFTIFYIVQIIDFVTGIVRLVDMYKFYTYLLNIPDGDIQTISWTEVVRRIGQIRDQNPGTAISSAANALDASALHHSNSPPTATLDAHDIANRIMRQENYLIALFNKDLLDLRVPLPPVLDRVFGGYLNRGNTLTRALEWNLRYCLMGHLFDRSGRVRKSLLKEKHPTREIELLRRRFLFMGFINAVFAPFIVLYLLMYSFFRYFEEYHKNPSSIGGRQYTPYAEWKFREFNELPHLFRRRLNESYPVASEYIDQFPKEKVALVMRFVAFIAGSFAAVLAAATLIDPDIFLHFEITPHRTVLFYLGLFGSILAVARGMVPDSHRVFDPEILMREVISQTHYMPTEWKGQLHSQKVQADFGRLFEMRINIFVQELLSVVLTPFVLWYSLPLNAPAIINFFREFTVHVDGLGYVCSFAVFDFKRHGNVDFGAPTEQQDERLMSNQGKMEKSFLNFKAANPEWNPTDPAGSAYLSRMEHFNQQLGWNSSPTRLRQQRSQTGMGQRLIRQNTPIFIHPNDTQFLSSMSANQPSGSAAAANEIKLAEKAAMYDRALQKSVSAARRRPPIAGFTPMKGKERAVEEDSDEDARKGPEDIEESELGDSYVHGVRTRGPRESDYLEEEEDREENGVMGMLAGIYNNQRKAIG